jgi:uncharacterized protein YdhG (YjbR/CyaY superfamily)
MAKVHFKTVDEYLAGQPPESRKILEQVRNAIRKAAPKAEESIAYNLPAYKLDGEPLIYFAGWKKHYSVYPATAKLVAALGDELAGYEVEKGTIRFPLTEPAPVKLIARITKLRREEAGERKKTKATSKIRGASAS